MSVSDRHDDRRPNRSVNKVFSISDAEDAVHSRDGYDYDGYKLRVEFPRGKERGPGGAFTSGSSRSRDSRRGPPARRSQFRVTVSGMFTVNQCLLFIVNAN